LQYEFIGQFTSCLCACRAALRTGDAWCKKGVRNSAHITLEGKLLRGVVVGDVPTFRMDHMPYGGVKDSGLGREGVRYAIEEMTERKLLAVNLR
jgi:acyl-CoA reductase-like NAD-dependent aldehyde dehydrogenase